MNATVDYPECPTCGETIDSFEATATGDDWPTFECPHCGEKLQVYL